MKNWVPDKTYEEDNGGDHVADLVNFKYRMDADQIIRIVGTVVNRSSTELRALVCFRVYDADGFEVHHQYSDNVKLKPGRSDSATGDEFCCDMKAWEGATTYKAYAAASWDDPPCDAISGVVEARMN
jgi:hypothetical protein